MLNKHFFKTVIIFSFLIIAGLIGIFVVSYLDNSQQGDTETPVQVAK